jgi:signal transduction histidine kinase
MLGAIFIPISNLHHLIILLNAEKRHAVLLRTLYLLSVLWVYVTAFTPLIVKKVIPISVFRFWPIGGLLFTPFLAAFAFAVFFAIYLIIKHLHGTTGIKRTQLLFVLAGTVIGWSGAATNFPLWYRVKILPVGNILVSVYLLCVGYAIVKHRLMDINLIIRKTLIYSIVMTIGTSLYIAIWGLFAFNLRGLPTLAQMFPFLLAAAIAGAAAVLSHDKIKHLVDKLFFREYVDREEKLYELSREIVIHSTPAALASAIIHVLTDAFHPKEKALYFQSGNQFFMASDSSVSALPEFFSTDDLLVQYLMDHPQPFITVPTDGAQIQNTRRYERIQEGDKAPNWRETLISLFRKRQWSFSTKTDEIQERQRSAVSTQILNYGIIAVFPLMSQGEFLGFLLLGDKRSEQSYSEEDIRLIRIVTNQAALAYQRVEYLQLAVKSARAEMLGHIAAGISHELRTPLANISMASEIIRSVYVEDLLDGKRSLKDTVQDMKESLVRIEDFTRKASERIEAIRQFAKPGDTKMEPVMLPHVIQGTLHVLTDLMRRTDIHITQQIPDTLSLILGNAKQLEVVFGNLFKNAAEAMEGSPSRELSIIVREETKQVVVQVKDTGPGIRKNNIENIFEGYWTTKGSQGTGMGLMMSKQMVNAHGGSLEVQSEEGKGTQFTVTFPKYAPGNQIKLPSAA